MLLSSHCCSGPSKHLQHTMSLSGDAVRFCKGNSRTVYNVLVLQYYYRIWKLVSIVESTLTSALGHP